MKTKLATLLLLAFASVSLAQTPVPVVVPAPVVTTNTVVAPQKFLLTPAQTAGALSALTTYLATQGVTFAPLPAGVQFSSINVGLIQGGGSHVTVFSTAGSLPLRAPFTPTK